MKKFLRGALARQVTGLVTGIALVASVGMSQSLAAVFNPKTKTLDNGLQVVVIENDRAPVVTNMVWYKVGAMDEPPGKSGIAHFFEHLMFKATEKLEAGEFSKIVARNGGQDNAFTAQDYTAYFQNIAADRLDLVMGMEADRMVNLRLDADVIEPERKVILGERQSRVDSSPGSDFGEEVSATLYQNHPYGIPIIGWEHEIKGLSLDDLQTFYKKYYAPNNAIVVVAGDVKADDVFAMAEKHFGTIPPSDIEPPLELAEPPIEARKLVEKDDPRVREISWGRRYIAPAQNTGSEREVLALQVLTEVLGSGNTSRLYKRLVIEEKQAVSAGSWYSGFVRGPGDFGFYAQPVNEDAIKAVETAVNEEIQAIIADGISEDELNNTIQKMLDSTVIANDSLRGPARTIGAALARGETIADVEEWPARIATVTVDEVKAVAAKVFAPTQGYVTSILRPAGKGA